MTVFFELVEEWRIKETSGSKAENGIKNLEMVQLSFVYRVYMNQDLQAGCSEYRSVTVQKWNNFELETLNLWMKWCHRLHTMFVWVMTTKIQLSVNSQSRELEPAVHDLDASNSRLYSFIFLAGILLISLRVRILYKMLPFCSYFELTAWWPAASIVFNVVHSKDKICQKNKEITWVHFWRWAI